MSHVVPVRIYMKVWTALLALLALTVGLAYVHLGWFHVVAAVTISFAKAVLIVLFFMHVKYKPRLVWVFVFAGLFWLAILATLSIGDYATRGWLPHPTVWLQ